MSKHCQWCEGEYLAGIDGQYRVPAVQHYNEYGDVCVMHAEWLNQYLKEMCLSVVRVTPSRAQRYKVYSGKLVVQKGHHGNCI